MRKNSNPPPYNKKAPIFQIPRRKQVQTYIGYACVLGVLLFILVRVLGRADSSGFRPFRTSISGASVVIVTVLDNKAEGSYLQVIRQNRQDYAKKQGKPLFWYGNRIQDIDCTQAMRPSFLMPLTTNLMERPLHGLR